MLVRRDQARKMLDLVHETREIGVGADQEAHLVAGIHRILGAAMTTFIVLKDAGEPRRRRLEHEVSTPSADRSVRTMIDALRTDTYVSSGLQELARRLRGKPMVTARRRELLPDEEWYGSESFNDFHRACGFDDFLYSFRGLGEGRVSGMAVRRALGERQFREDDRELLELFHEELARLRPAPPPDHGRPRLAPREREVLQCLLRGASEKEVAYELNLSQHTVHSYVKSIYSAHGVSTRAELLVRCLAG
jgi:DNA-binding CsgD family transcriptional regulator